MELEVGLRGSPVSRGGVCRQGWGRWEGSELAGKGD